MYLYDLGELKAEELSEEYLRHIAGDQSLSFAKIEMSQGEYTVPHTHTNDEKVIVLKGKLLITSDKGQVVVQRNQMLLIPSRMEHSAIAIEDTVAIDIRTLPGGTALGCVNKR